MDVIGFYVFVKAALKLLVWRGY